MKIGDSVVGWADELARNVPSSQDLRSSALYIYLYRALMIRALKVRALIIRALMIRALTLQATITNKV